MLERIPKKFALLIGIDHYGSSLVANLSGCVADVETVEAYLRDVAGLANIIKFTSPPSATTGLPTLTNIVNAFYKITAEVQPGDFVYLHYSGHGMRMVTAFPEFKTNQLDEALVLVGRGKEGIADGKLDYLRDVEMAYLLKRIADKGAVVSLVLDCCHSAGAVRGSNAIRGVHSIPPNGFVVERTPVVKDATLLSGVWRQPPRGTSGGRGASVVQHWMSSSKGIEFLAACRTNQEAQEVPRDGHPKHGLLSISLADVIRENRGRIEQLSCEMVYNLVAERVRTHPDIVRTQNVVFGGFGGRSFFGTESIGQLSAATVTAVSRLDESGTNISFNAGTAHGVREQQRFALYSADREFRDIVGYNAPMAMCRVIRVRDWDSDAQVTQADVEGQCQPTIQLGCKAVSVQDILYRYVLLPRTVRVVSDMPGGGGKVLDQALRNVERKIGGGRGLVRIATNDEEPFFEVRARPSGGFTIEFTPDAAAGARAAAKASSVDSLARYLAHLATFYNLFHLSSGAQPRRGGISAEIIGFLPRGSDLPEPYRFDANKPPRVSGLQPFPPQDPVEVAEEDTVGIRVTNRDYNAVYIELLDLEPSWKVSRIYPEEGGIPIQLSPNESADFFITMWIPATVPGSVQPAMYDAILILGTANEWCNFPEDVLPQLDQSGDTGGLSPVQREDGSRGGRGVASPKWFARRIDVRVIPERTKV
ncbi:Peptidase C14 caspase domain-containing protein [Madurella fahalii]|uniref:Peptidase C14 caspase domain-containing protein n=1 Tax=Madurella fahalii TaxID=1157608 RepID=A0ABQ0G2V7_9PEZI